MAIMVGLLFCATPGQAAVVNQSWGFENGDLTHWTVAEGSASIITRPSPDPTYGQYYLQLSSGPSSYGTLTRSISLDPGQTIGGWLQAVGNAVGVMIISSGGESKTVWLGSSFGGAEKTWSFTAGTGGNYTVSYTVYNGTMNIDNVPLPASVYLLGAGLVGLYGIRRKFFKKQGKAWRKSI